MHDYEGPMGRGYHGCVPLGKRADEAGTRGQLCVFYSAIMGINVLFWSALLYPVALFFDAESFRSWLVTILILTVPGTLLAMIPAFIGGFVWELHKSGKANAAVRRREQEEQAEKDRAAEEIRLAAEKKAAEERERVERAEREKADRARRKALEEAAKAESERRAAEQAELTRKAREAAFNLLPRVIQCGRDKQHAYPIGATKRCPFCEAEEGQAEVPSSQDVFARCTERLRARMPVDDLVNPPREAAASMDPRLVGERLGQLQENDDFQGAGSLILDVVMRCATDAMPDEPCRVVEAKVPALLVAKFKMPTDLAFERQHRDRNLAWHLRGEWRSDRLAQLIIDAYVLGATRSNFRPPHDRLAPYYRLMAQRQADAINEAIKVWKARRCTVDNFDAILNSDDPDFSPEAKVRAAKDLAGVGEQQHESPAPAPLAPEV